MSPATILVVEDNAITRKMVRVALEHEGYTVLDAPDGQSALRLMAQRAPDLVLQDIILPDMDGFELVKQLRALPGGAEIPILGFSGFLSGLEQARISGAGFTDYVFKPVEPSRLIQTIQRYLRRTSPIPEKPGRGRRVLVVDDDPIQRKLLTVQLQQTGFRVSTAEDGAEALEQARRSPPEAIATDALMPRLDGFSLCLAVRQDPQLARIPVVLFSSALTGEADHGLARSVGATALVPRTPDGQSVAEALLLGLSEEPHPVPVHPQGLAGEEYLHRVIRQLERQAAVNTSLTSRLALLETEVAVLAAIPEMLKSTPVIKTALNDLLQRCFDASGISLAAVYLLGPDGQLSLAAQVGHPDAVEEPLSQFFGQAELLRRALREGLPLLVPSPGTPVHQSEQLLASAGVKAMMIVPLMMGAEHLGILTMASRYREIGADRLSFLTALGGQIGQAIGLARAYERLAASEQHIRDLIQGLDAIIWEADAATLKFSFVSQRAEEVLGHPVWEWLTKPAFWPDHIHPEDRERTVALYRAAGSQARDFESEYRMVAANGRVVWIRDRVRVVRDAEGKVRQLRGLMTDITERKRAEEALRQSEARKGAILESALDCIITIDHEGRILEFNPAAEKTFGYTRTEVVGKEMAEVIIPPALRERHRRGLAHYLATGEGPVLGKVVEMPAMRADGTEFPVELGITRILLEGPPVFTGYVRDISERRRAQETLRALNEELRQAALQLEAKVEDRTRALQAANARLEEASRHKSEFLANMSHELRTPLNAVIGFSEFLQQQTVGSLNAKQARYVGHIQQSGKHLLQLINDILDLAKVEAGKVVLEPQALDVAATLEDILVIARGLAHKKAQTLEAEIAPDLPPLRADLVRFKQICFNLLSNAVKFTPEQGRISLTARRAPEAGDCLEIRVTDTGIGIRAQDLPRLFQEFVQLEAAASKRHEGTGLGLALTKRLVELHGGRIWAESEGEGRGSTFAFVLPVGGPGQALEASAGAPS